MSDNPLIPDAAIKFEGNETAKEAAIMRLEAALREQGDLGVYGDLSGGVAVVSETMTISIKETDTHFSVEIYPRSMTGGHDFWFTVDKETGKMSDVTIGEVLSDPDLEE